MSGLQEHAEGLEGFSCGPLTLIWEVHVLCFPRSLANVEWTSS